MINDLAKTIKYKPIILLILDGWGVSTSWGGNAISLNSPPTMNELWRNYPKTFLKAFELIAGKHGKVGNSEIGHASLGCGRMVDQDIVEIDRAIENNSFYNNPNLLKISQYLKDKKSTLHLIGLVSDGAVHSHIDHLFALLEFVKRNNVSNTAIHIITDGRDSNPMSALTFITKLEEKIRDLGFNSNNSKAKVRIASVIGRYWAMDRDGNTNLTEKAYKLQVYGEGQQVKSIRSAITESYQQGVNNDQYIPPHIILNKDNTKMTIKNNDAVLFFNFRSDRARQLTRLYVDKNYLKKWIFFRKYPLLNIYFSTITFYHLNKNLPINIIYNSGIIENSLAKIISNHGLKQLHLAESERYAHISYFFNGGNETLLPGEKRIIIPSKKIKNNYLNPEMSAAEITKIIISEIKNKSFDFIVANYANVDAVGHLGDLQLATKAVQSVDDQLKKILAISLKYQTAVIITADHGNAEQMVSIQNEDKETKHTLSPVPFILVTPNNKKDLMKSALSPTRGYLENILKNQHTLADVAPTVLDLLGITKPSDMTGKSLLKELE